MSPAIRCEEAEKHLPELAMGSLSGEERALVVSHLADCAPCRRLSEDLIGVVEELVVLTPGAEPPAGFEARVLAGMIADRHGHALRPLRRHRVGGRTRSAAPLMRPAVPLTSAARWVAAAAVVAAFVAGSAAGASFGPDRRPAPSVRNPGVLRSATLVGARGTTWGTAAVHAGTSGWVFVSMRWDLPDGLFSVQLTGPGIPTVQVEGLSLVNGEASLGRSVGGDLSRVQTVRVVDGSGREICRATLS